MPPCGSFDPSLKAGFADLNLSRRRRDHLAVVDQQGFGGVGSDRALAGDRDPRPVKTSVGEFDTTRMLGKKALPFAKVQQAGFEPPLLFWQCPSPRRQLQVLEAELVDCGGPLIAQLSCRCGRGDGIEAWSRAE